MRFGYWYVLIVAFCLSFGGAAFAQTSVNLNTWTERTNNSNGFWDVDDNGVEGSGPNGDFVVQEVNNAATIFASPDNFINTQVNGSFSVEPNSDDDFIGFVFGLQAPTTNTTDIDTLLFDWKQGNQSGATSGFRLAYVTGTIDNANGTSSDFWQHSSDADTTFQTLATNTNSDESLGWLDDGTTVYNFTLDYTTTNITITMAGGQFGMGTEIFNVDAADVPGIFPSGMFPDGQFGFYNLSQSDVTYQGFTRTEPALTTDPENASTLEFLARVGDSDSEAINVANTGGAGTTLTGSAGAPTMVEFSGPAEAPGFILSSGQSTDYTYTFNPTSRGSFSDSVEIMSNEDGSSFVNFEATAVGPEFDSSVDPGETIDFGNIDLDLVSMSTMTLDISNITLDENFGDDDLTTLTLNDFNITGANPGAFDLLTALDAILKGDTLTLTLKFAPGAAGSFNAVLTLLTDEGAALGGDGADYSWNLIGSAFNGGGPVVPTPAALPAGLALLGLTALKRRRG
ncbi:choice-of-anchor D domain-containing protein [Planctomycetales bacterium ZRK34]|nr:choice-of-anchor D domain-containing protein [Planctomycetales bacterium ZRK34]